MENSVFSLAAFLIGFVFAAAVGILGAFYPRAVQRAERIGPINLVPPFEFLRRYKQRPEYITQTRIAGILALVIAAAFLYGLLEFAAKLVK